MTREEILDYIEEVLPGEVEDITLAEESCDKAFLGIDSETPRAVYSTEICIHELSKTMGRSAEDYFNDRIYNNPSMTSDGLCTPLFISTPF
tara:strand:- start:925 stop:1197 length:273 start_codon:yes stop_codon:yes gene_type:complete